MRDRRWEPLLKGIQKRSQKPVSEMDGPTLMKEASISSNEILQTFKSQLYVYLKRFTGGDPLSYVLANGQESAFEAGVVCAIRRIHAEIGACAMNAVRSGTRSRSR